MKEFQIPDFYKSSIISWIKEIRRVNDPRKKDFSPTVLDFGPVIFYIGRHFGFCFGVENAIEISYRAIYENQDRRVFILSQMIHNPEVNNDLERRGVKFLMDTEGNQIIPLESLKPDDVVVIPAFGTTPSIENELIRLGIEVYKYNTTCPFVERVWKKSEKLGADKFTIIVHGKSNHEETRATFSRSAMYSPSIIIKDINEAKKLAMALKGEIIPEEFYRIFANRLSGSFDVTRDLQRIGIINQTTMLASETQEISDFLKDVMAEKYGHDKLDDHFADTRDTLCYATNENQEATYSLLREKADIAIVVGGYNSSNTSHIVKLCEDKLPTFFISSDSEIKSGTLISHYDIHEKRLENTTDFLKYNLPVKIILTSGASCPDSVVQKVMLKIVSFFENTLPVNKVVEEVESKLAARTT